jgi:hypothetical protein
LIAYADLELLVEIDGLEVTVFVAASHSLETVVEGHVSPPVLGRILVLLGFLGADKGKKG